MQEKMMVSLMITVVYLVIWYIVIKLRNTKNHDIRIWDNGYEFYSTLNEENQERYWQEDTNITKIFLLLLFLFLEGTLLFFIFISNNVYWIMLLTSGIIISGVTAIILSLKLRKKFKPQS